MTPIDWDGVPFQVGFSTGTAWYKDDANGPLNPTLVEVLKSAVTKGFVHFDCADSYGTETELGMAVKESGVHREQLFITTKVQNGRADVEETMDESLRRLQLEYLDL